MRKSLRSWLCKWMSSVFEQIMIFHIDFVFLMLIQNQFLLCLTKMNYRVSKHFFLSSGPPGNNLLDERTQKMYSPSPGENSFF